MDNQQSPKWYFKSWSLIISFLFIGPFMLPLVWTHPTFSKKTKIIISFVIIVSTYLLALIMVKSLKDN